MADTLTMEMPNGHRWVIPKQQVPDSLKKWLGAIPETFTEVIAALPLDSPDRNEDWFCIWSIHQHCLVSAA